MVATQERRLKRSDIPDAEIIAACNAYHCGTADTPDVALAHKYPPKLILAKMAHMDRRGILDYGVSLRTAWVVGGKKMAMPVLRRKLEAFEAIHRKAMCPILKTS